MLTHNFTDNTWKMSLFLCQEIILTQLLFLNAIKLAIKLYIILDVRYFEYIITLIRHT